MAEIDRVIAANVRFGRVLADAGYGISAAFRQGRSARRLSWAVDVPRTVKVFSTKAEVIWPVASRGPKRKQPITSKDGEDAASVLAKRFLAPRHVAEWHERSAPRASPRSACASPTVRPCEKGNIFQEMKPG